MFEGTRSAIADRVKSQNSQIRYNSNDDDDDDDGDSATKTTGGGGDSADANISILLVNVRVSEHAVGGSNEYKYSDTEKSKNR